MLSEIKQDRWERRGFLRTGALAFLNLKNVTLRLAWQAAGKQLPVDIEEVFSFTRQANTFAIAWYVEHGRHATRDEVFGKMVEHREHFKPGSWMSHLNPFSDEIFTGWFLDYANVTRGYPRRINDADEVNDGYRLIVRGESYCIITDESGVIYQAHTPKQVPTAATVDSAAAFPGAVVYTRFKEDEVSWLDNIKRFLTPRVVYAQINCCTLSWANCKANPSCGCQNCIELCCAGVSCYSSTPPAHTCFFNVGCGGPCNNFATACGDDSCTCCAAMWFHGCCVSLLCNQNQLCPTC